MKVLLLCGDLGRRMAPLREEGYRLDLLGRPLLLHVVDRLRDTGVDKFLLVGNRGNVEELRRLVSNSRDISSHVLIQRELSGVAGAVEAAEAHLDGPLLIVNLYGVVESSAYRQVVVAGGRQKCGVALLAAHAGRYCAGRYLVAGGDTGVAPIVEKSQWDAERSEAVNPVVHYHRNGMRLLQALARVASRTHDRYQAALSLMIDEGMLVHAVPYYGFRVLLQHPWDVLASMDHFVRDVRRCVSTSALIAPGALIEGAVVVADGAKVMENAIIRGPAYIGERAVIGNNVLIRGGSHIGADSVVGFSTEVKHSYIGQHCWFHSNYVGDSVVDDHCSFGSGAITANLRFDEADVKVEVDGVPAGTNTDKLGVIAGRGSRVGINASLMPGVMIGPGSIVGPQVCLTRNLKPGQRALVQMSYVIEDTEERPMVAEREVMRRRLEGIQVIDWPVGGATASVGAKLPERT